MVKNYIHLNACMYCACSLKSKKYICLAPDTFRNDCHLDCYRGVSFVVRRGYMDNKIKIINVSSYLPIQLQFAF